MRRAYLDPTSSRSISVGSSRLPSTLEQRLLDDEERCRQKQAEVHRKREEARARAQQIDEARVANAERVLAREAHIVETQLATKMQAHAQRVEGQHQAWTHHQAMVRQMEASKSARATNTVQQLQSHMEQSAKRHSEALLATQMRLAHERQRKEEAVQANRYRIEQQRAHQLEVQSQRNSRSGSPAVSAVPPPRLSPRYHVPIDVVQRRHDMIMATRQEAQIARQLEAERKANEAIAMRNQQLEERRIAKANKEWEARLRVERREQQREERRRLYEERYLQAVDIGCRVRSHNAMYH